MVLKALVSVYMTINLVILLLATLAVCQTNAKHKTCVDVRNQNPKSENGFYTLYAANGSPYTAFCDMQSDPGFAWTLIESLSLANGQLTKFRKSFYYNVPSHDCSPNWSSYRLSKSRMMALSTASSSTHFRATCNFNASSKIGLQNYRDYLRVSLCAYKLFLSSPERHTCAVVDYINIRGYSCSRCSIPFHSGRQYHLHIYIENVRNMCDRIKFPNAVSHENEFGHYQHINTQFSCSATPTSTTNWWIGGTYFRQY